MSRILPPKSRSVPSVDSRFSPTFPRMRCWTAATRLICLLVLITLASCRQVIGPQPSRGWQAMKSGTFENLRGVWGLESGDVFAVGDNGTILHFDGKSWRMMQSNTTADLVGVWARDADNVVAAGDGGTVLYYNGESWAPMESGTTAPIGAMWGLPIFPQGPSQLPFWVWAVGGGPPGTVLHFDGRQWQSIDTGGSEEFIDITGWLPPPEASDWRPRLMTVGANGTARFLDGDGWRETDTGVAENLVAVFGDSPDNVYAVGSGGTIIQNTRRFADTGPVASWREVTRVEGGGLSDITARNYNDLFLVGADGQIVNFDRVELTDMRSRTSKTLHAVWSGMTDVFAVGDEGTILRYSRRPRHRECPINVRVTVTAGTTPVISWSPSCPVSKVVVEDDWGTVQWFVEAEGNLIYPGVKYGTAPPRAVERRPTNVPLLEGGLYRVVLMRRDWDREVVVGSWNLTPQMSPPGGPGPVTLSPTSGPDQRSGPLDHARFFHFQRLLPTGTGPNQYAFDGLTKILDDEWRMIGDPMERETVLDVRPVIVEVVERDPDTGETRLIILQNVRIAELRSGGHAGTFSVVWDMLEEN